MHEYDFQYFNETIPCILLCLILHAVPIILDPSVIAADLMQFCYEKWQNATLQAIHL